MTVTWEENRPEPGLPVHMMRTFTIAAPVATHWRRIQCEDTGWCRGWDKCLWCQFGWQTIVPADSVQAHYIRAVSGRRFTELVTPEGLARFTFEGGQRCFSPHEGMDHPPHYERIEREERFIVRGGDHRGNPTREHREHTKAEFWREEFAETLDRIKTLHERG